MLTSLGSGLAIGVILALTGADRRDSCRPCARFGVHQSVAQAGLVGLLAVGMAAALGVLPGLRSDTVRYRAAMLISADDMALSVGKANTVRNEPPCIRDGVSGCFVWTSHCALALALSGGVAGLLSGLLGVGGGFVMVTPLRRYTDLDIKSVVATSPQQTPGGC